MSDLISRQEAIDASCKDWCGCTYANCPNQFNLESERFCDGCDTVVILKKMPSVQPEQPEWVQTVERWYNKALCTPYIQKPIAWALYQAWKEYNNE